MHNIAIQIEPGSTLKTEFTNPTGWFGKLLTDLTRDVEARGAKITAITFDDQPINLPAVVGART